MVFNDKTNKIEKNDNRNMIEIYNQNNGNSNSNLRCTKRINLFINNEVAHFEQITNIVVIIEIFLDNDKINDVLSTMLEIEDR